MRATTILAAIVAIILPAAASAGPSPSEVAAQIEAFYQDKTDIRATFTQAVRKPGRRRVLRKSGAVFFKRPGMMRWEYKKPEVVFYISDGDVLWSFQPEDSLVTRLNVKSSELYHQSRYLFGQGDLAKDFDLAEGTSDDDAFALVLQPRQQTANFKQLTLFVDPATGEIRRTELVDPYDNVSTITFDKVQFVEVEPSVFTFTPPPNATIRDLSNGGQQPPPNPGLPKPPAPGAQD